MTRNQPPAAAPSHHRRAACVTVPCGPCLVLCSLLLALLIPAAARTSNGNDFALYLSEARSATERQKVLDEARNRPHFFRYLQVMEMRTAEVDGAEVVQVTAFEPASRMDVKFTVALPLSLALLREEPATKIGDAIAVTGIVTGADRDQNTITLGQTIVRHKDRLSPKIGKELLCEVNPGAVFYNYTAGRRPVSLTYKDRDLIHLQQQIVAEKGPDGWVEFLERELARRNQERQTATPGGPPAKP